MVARYDGMATCYDGMVTCYDGMGHTTTVIFRPCKEYTVIAGHCTEQKERWESLKDWMDLTLPTPRKQQRIDRWQKTVKTVSRDPRVEGLVG